MTTETVKSLTLAESNEYHELATVIQKGAKTFLEVGQALVRVHDGKLYRADYATFKEFAEAHDIGVRQAYKLMSAVQLTMELENVYPGHIENHTQNIENLKRSSAKVINQLKKSPPKQRAKILDVAVIETGGNLTAKSIEIAEAKVTRKALPAPQPGIPADIENPVVKESLTPEPPTVMTRRGVFTPERFKLELGILEKMANESAGGNQKEREKYGVHANALANRLMNPIVKQPVNPYTS